MLWLGIGATVGANAAYGAASGLLGAVISAWAAVAFIGSVEMVMLLVLRARRERPEPAAAAVAADAESAARVALAASIAAGSPLSQREITRPFGMPRSQAAVLARER
jgi:hypothetical protein